MRFYMDMKLGHFHIPKTGGASVVRWLKYCFDAGKLPGERDLVTEETEIGAVRRHSRLEEIHELMDPNKFDSALIFTTIRNPYATVSSLYSFARQIYKNLGGPPPNLPQLAIANEVDFPGFVEWYEAGWPSYFEWLAVNGEVPENVRFLKLENLQADLDGLLNGELKLGVDLTRLQNLHETGGGAKWLERFGNQKRFLDITTRKEKWIFDRGFYEVEQKR